MHDGSRHFADLPESCSWGKLRKHIERLSGAKATDYVADNATEMWLDFSFRGHAFTVNNQFGDFWFFVRDPACPNDILVEVVEHCESLIPPRQSRTIESTRPRRAEKHPIAEALFVVAMLNFVAFILLGQLIGGYPTHGGEADGKYFLARTYQGSKTWVSESTYRYSRWHERSLLVTHPLGIVSVAFAYRKRRRNRNSLIKK
jgi:hypothetical protein